MHDFVFIPADFLMVRAAIWPFEKYQHLIKQINWQEKVVAHFHEDPLLREAVSLASPKLYQALISPKDKEQAATSLFNYIIRMTTRATPFGLFSFIAEGSWSDESDTHIDGQKVKKRARPDMQWVYELVQGMCKDKQQFLCLEVRANPLVVFKNKRIFVTYTHSEQTTSSQSAPSIFASKLAIAILELAKTSYAVSELIEKIKEVLPTIDQERTLGVIQELVRNEFLVLDMLPSLLSKSPFRDLYNSLNSFSLSAPIRKIMNDIEAYNALPLGQGEDHLSKLHENMNRVASSKYNLQVDSYCTEKKISINKAVRDELQKATALLWKIADKNLDFPHLASYHTRFLERYGTKRRVPLLEVLSEERGLGSFKQATNTSLGYSPFYKLWIEWLNKAKEECLHLNKIEITIDEALIERLYKRAADTPKNPHEACVSFDAYCKIHADSSAAIDNGDFLLQLFETRWQGLSTFGRFYDLFHDETEQKFQEFLRREEQLEEADLFVELSYWPQSTRHANVAIHPQSRIYKLDLQAKNKDRFTLSLDDIYVGSNGQRLYLTLKEGNVELNATFGNLLNFMHAPKPLWFMREVSLAKYHCISPFSWGEIENHATLLPRVRFNKTIFSCARWNLDPHCFNKEPSNITAQDFLTWAEQWRLPKLSCIGHEDQCLLIDKDHPGCLKNVLDHLKLGKMVTFTEHLPNTFVTSPLGHHASEIVVPFIKSPKYHKKERGIVACDYQPLALNERWKFPTDDWICIKLYLSEASENFFLVYYLLPFIVFMQKQFLIEGCFYVRYKDPESHIRFRINITSPSHSREVFALLAQAACEWMKAAVVRNFCFFNYEREIERYGGLACLEAIEEVFFKDTLASLSLLRFCDDEKISDPTLLLFPLIAIHFLNMLSYDSSMAASILKGPEGVTHHLEGFHKHKGPLLQKAQALEENLDIFATLTSIYSDTKERYHHNVASVSADNACEIADSLLHMHLNRLGCASRENQVRAYAHQILVKIHHKQKRTLNAFKFKDCTPESEIS